MADAVGINELKELLAHGERLSIIDVRRKSDYEATAKKVFGAKWYDPERTDEWVEQLPAGNRTVVYCVKGGSISQSVADRLRDEGLDAVFLEGGLKKWMETGQPVEATAASQDAYIIQDSDVDLLRMAGVSEEDIAHSVKVAVKALEIADRLVDIITDGVVKEESEAEEQFEEILSRNVKYGKNELTLRRYLGYHREIQELMRISCI